MPKADVDCSENGEDTPELGAKRAAEKLLEDARLENARPIIDKPIPPVPPNLGLDEEGLEKTTLVLFYQYVEPPWTAKQHKKALNFVASLGKGLGVTGRGRCAREGLNCTCTGPAEGVRAFCQGLREWNPLFEKTDFKFTDGLGHRKRFKALTIRKVDELVAYGLEGSYAPSLHRNAAVNLEADSYHEMMADPKAVIIDVRNVYESAIGHFQPPEDGAELIIPPVRHSFEFPRWFNDPSTKEKLHGKKVMMYCTGGIRCERATALMDQIEKVSDGGFETEGIYHCQGGIERYMKTFPKGGFWKGRNYLFDRRLEQTPELKSKEKLEKEVQSVCSVCHKPWGIYRGAKTCSVQECKIPVIVCDVCQDADPKKMKCPLCTAGEKFKLRQLEPPRLVNAENATRKRRRDGLAQEPMAKKANSASAARGPSERLFVGKLPLTIDAKGIGKALGAPVKTLKWITDHETGAFYGSVFAELESVDFARKAVEASERPAGIKLGKRRLRVCFSKPHDDERWPPKGHTHLERPPIPI